MRRCLPAIALALTAALTATPAAADTFKPTRLDDPPPGKCKPANCSLREAINAASVRNGDDRVVLGEGTYELEIPIGSGGSADPAEGDLNPGFYVDSGTLTVVGRGTGKTRIDANEVDRVMQTSEDVKVKELTVKDGYAGTSAGGGILVSGVSSLMLEHVAIKRSFASRGGGLSNGGIVSGGSTVKLSRVVIKGNEAAFGGGVYSSGPKLAIRESTIAQNNANEGGGIDLRSGPIVPVTTIRSSTISGNFAGKGAGIHADRLADQDPFFRPAVTVVNSTVAANSASGQGGGIMADNGSTMTLDNSTVAYNRADDDNIGGGVGGGVHQHQGAVFGLGDSIVAANFVGSSGAGPQCDGSFAGTGGGVVQSQASGTCTLPGSLIVDIANLGPLADHGGPTETVNLQEASPAIGFAESCPATDQRGKPRPDVECDSGSFERAGP